GETTCLSRKRYLVRGIETNKSELISAGSNALRKPSIASFEKPWRVYLNQKWIDGKQILTPLKILS
ncbi:MAG TPA: hypothetical protein PK389_02145, partial [Gammaproteobacteria bacterium]|nr:hypothetical protein [Gammaproteobacteria bacterium]